MFTIAVVLSALGLAAVAQAAVPVANIAPEVGRCVEQASGKYVNAGCTERGKPGTYEWLKGALDRHFMETGGETVFAGPAGSVECVTEQSVGEYASSKSGAIKAVTNVVLKFAGCKYPSGPECHSSGQALGELSTNPLKGKLAYIAGKGTTSATVGLSLTPVIKGAFMEFECPAIGIIIYIGEGPAKGGNTVIGSVEPLNAMGATLGIAYSGSKGIQSPQHFENGRLANLEASSSGPRGTFEVASMDWAGQLTNSESLEIRDSNHAAA